MLDRRNQILSVLLVLQLALAAFILWPRSSSNAATGALITGVTTENVTDVTIEGDDRLVHLAKVDGAWVLPENANYPVNEVQVSGLISKVASINTSRLVANTATSHTRLQVADDDFVRRIEMKTADGATHTLFVGSAPNVRATNVRTANSDTVYLTGDLTGTDIRTDIANWIDTTYLTLNTADVTALSIANVNGKFDFTRGVSNTWTLADLAAGEQFNENNLTSRLTQLSSLQMTEPLAKEAKPEYGLDTPSATITVTVQPSGTTPVVTTLVVGAKDDTTNSYMAKSSGSDYYVRIASFSLDPFVTADRSQFLVAPPTATPVLTPVSTPAAAP